RGIRCAPRRPRPSAARDPAARPGCAGVRPCVYARTNGPRREWPASTAHRRCRSRAVPSCRHGSAAPRAAHLQEHTALNESRLDLDQALEAILADTRPVSGEERVAVAAALGRVLARSIDAPVSLPPFAASAMDGYALRSRDVGGPPPYRLRLAGTSYAGHPVDEPTP